LKIEIRKSKLENGMEDMPFREEVALSLGKGVHRDGAFTGCRGPGEGSVYGDEQSERRTPRRPGDGKPSPYRL
jgi:hypothetical protein